MHGYMNTKLKGSSYFYNFLYLPISSLVCAKFSSKSNFLEAFTLFLQYSQYTE